MTVTTKGFQYTTILRARWSTLRDDPHYPGLLETLNSSSVSRSILLHIILFFLSKPFRRLQFLREAVFMILFSLFISEATNTCHQNPLLHFGFFLDDAPREVWQLAWMAHSGCSLTRGTKVSFVRQINDPFLNVCSIVIELHFRNFYSYNKVSFHDEGTRFPIPVLRLLKLLSCVLILVK